MAGMNALDMFDDDDDNINYPRQNTNFSELLKQSRFSNDYTNNHYFCNTPTIPPSSLLQEEIEDVEIDDVEIDDVEDVEDIEDIEEETNNSMMIATPPPLSPIYSTNSFQKMLSKKPLPLPLPLTPPYSSQPHSQLLPPPSPYSS